MHQTTFDQLLDELLAQAPDIHGLARGEVLDSAHPLGRAVQPTHAAVRRFVGQPQDFRITNRTTQRHLPGLCRWWTFLLEHHDHFRNYIPGTAHQYRVAHAYIFTIHLILIMQTGAGRDPRRWSNR